MLDKILVTEAYAYLLAFCRIGSIALIVPFLSQPYIAPRIRLLLSLTLTAMLAPAVYPFLPSLPPLMSDLASLILSEILVGVLIGTISLIVIQTIALTGTHIAFLVGLSNAVLFNPQGGDQSVLPSAFLLLTAIAFIFATNLDHLIYIAMMQSYSIFPAGEFPIFADSANSLARTFGDSFALGLQMASPFIILSLIFNLLSGVVSRLMPQFQVFFVLLPLQLFGGMALLLITLPAILTVFAKYYQDTLSAYFNI